MRPDLVLWRSFSLIRCLATLSSTPLQAGRVADAKALIAEATEAGLHVRPGALAILAVSAALSGDSTFARSLCEEVMARGREGGNDVWKESNARTSEAVEEAAVADAARVIAFLGAGGVQEAAVFPDPKGASGAKGWKAGGGEMAIAEGKEVRMEVCAGGGEWITDLAGKGDGKMVYWIANEIRFDRCFQTWSRASMRESLPSCTLSGAFGVRVRAIE